MFHLPNNKLLTVHVHYSIIILCVILSRIGQDTEKTPKHNANTHLFSSLYVWIQYKYIQQRSASSFWLTMVPVVVFKMTVLSKHWQFTCTWLELTWLETRKNVDWVLLSIFSQSKDFMLQLLVWFSEVTRLESLAIFQRDNHAVFFSYHNDSMLGWRQIKRRLILCNKKFWLSW